MGSDGLMMPKLNVGICQQLIWTSRIPLDSVPVIPVGHSIHVNPGTIPVEFEFCFTFWQNGLINLAGPSAKFDSSRIPGIGWILAGISGGQ